ncbi:mannitol dehydrogenase family protein [Natronosporangium hydrolyticum]|uniref:Mannitol-1-phosphate 5-dehydrogenase n=1 Tax=Natronosporangium hydrolyticum TaxID=2811111 RepID=A0A895YID3_9ACTN|nr:mannitol dehydrogenase family protein [Natronosporangium hydrolyticum]QSB15775.1 mannitol dehydrogenase family protein [Natronosporangium hydrolyticum]
MRAGTTDEPGVTVDRLCRATISRLPPASRPLLDPADLRPGILHLGLGAFHRAHQAVFTEAAIAARGGDWGIVAVAPRNRPLVDALTAQDGLFSVASRDQAETDIRVVGALHGVRHAPSDPGAVVALLADPAIRVVTLTVTEKAYRLDPATGQLQLDAALRAELTRHTPPASVPALLALGLSARARADAGPLAVVSCDNLPANGRQLASMARQALTLAEPPAVDWVTSHVRFPSTMVDRIVPATTPETLATVRSALGLTDEAAVAAEPYRQWVIEDDFPAGRPAWEAAGAVLTDDAGPYERLKLRALNGVHSTLAYLGALAGCRTIDQALALPGASAMVSMLLRDDIAASLTPPAGVSVAEYGQSVLDRFANPATGHRTRQVAMDGSQKLPQRLVHMVADRRSAGELPQWGALALAAWMRFVCGQADDGRALPLDDPLADEIRHRLAAAERTPAGVVTALLGLESVFPASLRHDAELADLLTQWLTTLARHGVRDTLAGMGVTA